MQKNSCVRKNTGIDDFDIFAHASSPHDHKIGHRATCTEIAQANWQYLCTALANVSDMERNLEWNSATNHHERQIFSL